MIKHPKKELNVCLSAIVIESVFRFLGEWKYKIKDIDKINHGK